MFVSLNCAAAVDDTCCSSLPLVLLTVLVKYYCSFSPKSMKLFVFRRFYLRSRFTFLRHEEMWNWRNIHILVEWYDCLPRFILNTFTVENLLCNVFLFHRLIWKLKVYFLLSCIGHAMKLKPTHHWFIIETFQFLDFFCTFVPSLKVKAKDGVENANIKESHRIP